MRGSTMTGIIVASQFSHATQFALRRDDDNFRDNTYNEDLTPDEADMSS